MYQDVDLNDLGVKGKTVTIVFPGAPTVSNDAISVGAFQAPTSSTESVTLSQMPSVNMEVLDWEKLIANPNMIRQAYVQPAMAQIWKYLNGQLATLIDTTDLPTYTPVASVTANTLTLAQLRDARLLLQGNLVPVDELGSMTLAMQPTVYEYTLITDSFNRADIRGPEQANQTWMTGALMQTFATKIVKDHDLPTVDEATDKRTSVLFHEYAIGAAYRPMPIPDAPGVEGSYIDLNGLPIRVMFSYSHEQKSYLLSFDLAFGFAVLRPECAVLIYHTVS